MNLLLNLLRPACFFAVICATVLATEYYFDYQHGRLHQVHYELIILRK